MTSTYYYNQQQPNNVPPMPQKRGMPGQIGISPSQGHFIQQQQQQQQQQYRNQALQDPNALRKRSQNKPSRQAAPMVDDADEPSGDELDDISARDIAMARYKRNHDYLSEIFTPYNAASIIPPSLEFTQTKEELDKQIKECKERAVRQKKVHSERMIQLEKEKENYWNLLDKLNEASTIEAIDQSAKELAQGLNVEIEHTPSSVKIIAIPGLEDEDSLTSTDEGTNNENHTTVSPQKVETNEQNTVEENKDTDHAEDDTMDMFLNDDQQQDGENTDSFFNEMVNTDDDPSVNEFLNTD